MTNNVADTKKKIALLSNITVDLIVRKLHRKYEFYTPEGFDTWVQEAINPAAALYSEKIDAAMLLLDGMEAYEWKSVDEGRERIALWKQAVSNLTDSIQDIPVFISTISFQENRIKSFSERKFRYEWENDWYQYIQGLVETRNNIYIFDLAEIVTEIGRKNFYSNKMWYMSSMPYSRDGLNALSAEMDRTFEAAFSVKRKIIVLDLDNTLWGGVVGEDGIEGIELSNHKEGQRYYDFQRQLYEMKNRGIILAINSKNNAEDAEAVIQGHPFMLLHDDDFVSRKINWNNKAINLKEMENELNLTEGGFIFIDDNPVERETVRGECPDVLVPDFPADTTELSHFAENIWFNHCQPLRVLGEDLNKTKMYQNEAKRKQEMTASLSLDEYIAKLEPVADIHKMQTGEVERVTQLINKTNQFNVTTKRYTRAQIEEISSNPSNAVYVVNNSDKYGDNGLISVIILIGSESGCHIDTFLMSCRVMGRKLEEVIINELAARYKTRMTGEYIPTAKNVPVKNLYERLGFTLISDENGHKRYEFDAKNYVKKDFSMYKVIISD